MEHYKDVAAELAAAKADFRKSILADDTSYEVITAHLNTVGTDSSLPGFAVEPTLERTKDKSLLGLRLTLSRASETDEMAVKISFYEHILIGELDPSTGDVKVSSELTALLSQTGHEKADAMNVISQWQRGLRTISERVGDEGVLDPATHTITLRSELASRASLEAE